MRQLLGLLQRPKFWLVVAWVLLPINIISVLWYRSVPATLALCVNVAVVIAPLWRRSRR